MTIIGTECAMNNTKVVNYKSVSNSILKHPLPNPPPSRGRELFGNLSPASLRPPREEKIEPLSPGGRGQG